MNAHEKARIIGVATPDLAGRTFKRFVSAALCAALLISIDMAAAAENWGAFQNRPLRLQDLVPPDGRRFILEQEFDYSDPRGRLWKAPPGSIIDGASIPKPFWSVIGGPYEGLYREASVVHDIACCAQTERWQDAHHMFYDAMRCSGVGFVKAKIMFYAVWAGGPRWKTLQPQAPGACKGQLHVDANIEKKIIEALKSRPLSQLESEAVARPFVTQAQMTSEDVSRVIADLKGRDLRPEERAIITQSVVETVHFPPEEVRRVAQLIEKNDPEIEEIQKLAEQARSKIRLEALFNTLDQSYMMAPTEEPGKPAPQKNKFFPDVPGLTKARLDGE